MSPASPLTTLSPVLRLTAEGEAMLSRGILRAWLGAVAALAIAFAAPAGAAAEGVVGACPSVPYEQPFTPWLDFASYVLAPNGGLESGAAGWSLDGGAAVVAGNESFYVRDASDTRSLSLPAGSSATTSSMCVDARSPDLRLFVRNSGSLLSTLKVEALYTDALGQPRALTVAVLAAGSRWQPTLPVAFLANLTAPPLVTDGTTSVAFRFTPLGSWSGWRIDDVYVDPFKGE
jgi:hypothetical protein